MGKLRYRPPLEELLYPLGTSSVGKIRPQIRPRQHPNAEKRLNQGHSGASVGLVYFLFFLLSPYVHETFSQTGTDKSQLNSTSRGVFGVALEESLEVAQIATLPAVIFRCIEYLEAKQAEQEEGIYRLSGSSAVIKSLKDRFNAGKLHLKSILSGISQPNKNHRGGRRPASVG
jgi:hypothetical protein